jgi:hypothetical protein
VNRNPLRTLITEGFNNINSRLDQITMTEVQTQTDIDNATATVTGLLTDLSDDNSEILTDLQTLVNSANSGTPITTDALNAVIGKVTSVQTSLDGAVGQLNTLAAPPVVTPPVTTTSSVPTPSARVVPVGETLNKSAVAPELTDPIGNKGASLMGLGDATPSSVPATPADGSSARMDALDAKMDAILEAISRKA